MVSSKYGCWGRRVLFTPEEKRNIFIYILTIMFYKFGVEAFNGSMITLATNRYDQDAHRSNTSTRTFEHVGLLIGLNQAAQCIGSVLIGPLIKRWRTQLVLAATIFIFALSTAVFMIVDVSTGGYIKPKQFLAKNSYDFPYYGKYDTNMIIPIYCVSGITFGMVESIRRVIPANIAGDDVLKLRKMDALVHVFYEVAGVSGALMTALVLIPRLGSNYSFIITPIFFTMSGIICLWIRSTSSTNNQIEENQPVKKGTKKRAIHYLKSIARTLLLFIRSIFIGAKIVFTSRRFLWLFAAYPLAIYSHRYIENSVTSQVARRYLHNSSWSQILVGGSNLGELFGALFIFFFNDSIKSPILWVRFDALMLFIVWYIPFYYPPTNQVTYAWIMAATLIPIGFGSAIGDISLDAYIQSSVSRLESKHKHVSPLGAVMAFLYSTYIIIYSIANPFLGRHIDYIYNTTGTIRSALIYTTAVQLTIVFIIIFLATFIPKGAVAFNPSLIDEEETTATDDTAGENIALHCIDSN